LFARLLARAATLTAAARAGAATLWSADLPTKT